ncbi:unnamed protein product, partial [Rotaria sp. Silwood2]
MMICSAYCYLLIILSMTAVNSLSDLSERVKTSIKNFNLTEARQVLCPIGGYQNAHYCPGINETTNDK